jgi:NAD(P)-dependent dehydrogenase (short-subunit alcohol dehydrogenase family)
LEDGMGEGKVAIITGASSGIGRAAAIGLARAGYRVAICGRREAELAAAAAEAPIALAKTCDVTDPESVAALFAAVVEKFGRIDVVFNNAGRTAKPATVGELEIDTWRNMIDTNLNGAFYVAREAFRQMQQQSPQGGRIINNGSISAHVPRPRDPAYAASKHAITGLTKAISLDGRPFNIACGQIDIGNTLTTMTADMSAGKLQADGSLKPEPTFEVRHVVDAILYMAGLPLEANVQFMTVMATGMPFIGRG